MRVLPPALAPLGRYRQFIVCLFVPDAKRPGKTEKFPINVADGSVSDAHNPAIWLSFDEAAAIAAAWGLQTEPGGRGYGVGFVITKNDPFSFIDADNCAVPGGWSPIVGELMTALPGAAIEVSQSQRGLHMFCTGTAPAERKVKAGILFDLYTEGRFVALTGLSAMGDADTDCTAGLHALVDKYLKGDPATVPAEWSEGPVPEWRGPTDDTILINRALRSKSTASMFGSKASFEALWTGDADALTKAYPDDQGLGGYDESKADAALAQHLSFWTGKDCARIERLMRQSALARPKWDERADYLAERTILGCVARQTQVLYDPPAELPVVEEAPGIEPDERPRPKLTTGNTNLTIEEQIKAFTGCVYVVDQHRVLVPSGILVKPEQFKVLYGGMTMTMDPGNTRTSRDSWEVFTQSEAFKSPRADGVCFKPGLPPGAIIRDAGRTRTNIWWPVEVPRKKGDAGPFLRHLAKILPNERDQTILLSYMAACVQHVGTKFQWAPLIQGVEGNGKTTFSRCVAEAVGRRYTHWPAASKLGSQFNKWLLGNVFYAVEDIYIPGDRGEVFEVLKPMITGRELEIEGKGVDQQAADVCGNFIFNSNHQDGIRKTRNDRRFGMFYCAQQKESDLERDGLTGDYFERLNAWLQADGYAIVAELLHTYPIAPEFNPATGQRAPMTSSTEAAIEAGLGVAEQEIMEQIEQGRPGFAGGWVSSLMLKALLSDLRLAGRWPLNTRVRLMASLGYELHPGLPKGRTHNMVPSPDGGVPQLFITRGHPSSHLKGAEVSKAYVAAQNVVAGAVNSH